MERVRKFTPHRAPGIDPNTRHTPHPTQEQNPTQTFRKTRRAFRPTSDGGIHERVSFLPNSRVSQSRVSLVSDLVKIDQCSGKPQDTCASFELSIVLQASPSSKPRHPSRTTLHQNSTRHLQIDSTQDAALPRIFARTRIEFARNKSSFEFMSLVSEEVTMMTSSGLQFSATSLMKKYTIRRRDASFDLKCSAHFHTLQPRFVPLVRIVYFSRAYFHATSRLERSVAREASKRAQHTSKEIADGRKSVRSRERDALRSETEGFQN